MLPTSRHQDDIRSASKDLIKLSQRFGRMMPRLSKLDSSAILSWFGQYNESRTSQKADDELTLWPITAAAAVRMQLQMNYYYAQRQRLCFKTEVMDISAA
jgi:hypothetical protein